MNGDKLKKQLILNLPYILIGLYATKLGEAWRLAEGADASQKFLHLMDGFTAAFQSPLPSFQPYDHLIGLMIGGTVGVVMMCLLQINRLNDNDRKDGDNDETHR